MFGNLSWRVWIIFRLNLKTLFWRYMFLFTYPLQILLSNVFPINMICNFGGWLQNYLTTAEQFWASMFHCSRPAIQFCQEICSRGYSIVLANICGSYFSKIVAYDVFAVFAVLRTGKGGKYSFKILGKSKIGLFLVC